MPETIYKYTYITINKIIDQKAFCLIYLKFKNGLYMTICILITITF